MLFSSLFSHYSLAFKKVGIFLSGQPGNARGAVETAASIAPTVQPGSLAAVRDIRARAVHTHETQSFTGGSRSLVVRGVELKCERCLVRILVQIGGKCYQG